MRAMTVIVLVCAATAGTAIAAGLGDIPEGGFRSPEGDTRFTAEAGARPLNNLVFELLNVPSPGPMDQVFRNPREGWVYLRLTGVQPLPGQQALAYLDGREVPLQRVGEQYEAMRYVGEGPHSVGVSTAVGAGRLEVRAIGELFYAAYGSDPHIPELGVYTWDYLRRHCLDSFNSMIGTDAVTADGKSTQEAEIREWVAGGKRWFTLHPVPDDVRVKDPTETADEAYEYWTQTLGMQHPLMSGIWADEFGPRQARFFPLWSEALRRIHADPNYADRKFYAYVPNRFWPLEDGYEVMFPFMQTLMDLGHGMGPEWYQVEGYSRPGRIIEKTDDLLAEFGPEWEMASRQSFERAAPGSAANRIVVISLLSEPGWESGDLFANYDYNVFLDAQLQFIATDPAFFGTRGLQGYLSSYCGEEQLRLFARLVRHYAIEGRTDRLLKDPYVLTYLRNPDFVDGSAGWTLEPATEGSIAARTVPGFGTLQAKYHGPEGVGDKAVWTRRSAGRPNLISQQVRGLEPGRLYSLRFITGDFGELQAGKSEQRQHAVSVRIEDTEPVPDRCFQAVVGAGYWYPYGGFNGGNPYWLNLHQQVFRAKRLTARLVLSDWASDAPGGPAGQELVWNFMQLQPYFEADKE